MFPDDPKSTAFPLFESTILNQTVTSITWSPSNDLCVLVYQDNSISLCRATTVSIWTFSDLKSKVTAIAWHPNGQEFVVGCLDGTIYQVSAIKFIPNFILCWPPCDCVSNPADGISSLLWIDYSPDLPTVIVPGFDPTAFDMQSHLPALSMVPPEEPVSLTLYARHIKSKDTQLPSPPTCLDKKHSLLLIGDRNSSLHLSLNAGYHIGTIRCTQQISKGSIKNISLSQNDSTIQILIQHTGTANYEMVTLNSQFLQSKKLPLCNVATIERQINYLLQYIHQCTKALEAHRTVYATLAKRNVERISDIVKQGNSELLPLPHIELLGLLVTGNLNGALPEYFSEEMTQQKATQWETKSLHSYSRIQRIIIEYLQPASERLLLNLSQLHGYGLWTERYSDLLCSDTITTAIELTRHYLWITQQLLQDTGKASRRFEEFIKWIVRVVQKIADQGQTDYMNNPSGPLYQNPNLIVDYLLKDFGFDSLACYFDDIDQNSPLTMEIDEPQTIKNDVSSSNITRSLRSAYNDMAKHCKTILEEPANTMSHLITPLDTIHLDLSPTINADKSLHTFSNETPGRNEAARLIESKAKMEHYYAFVKKGFCGNDQVVIVRIIWKEKHKQSHLHSVNFALRNEWVAKESCVINLGQRWCVSDIEFMDDKELALILQQCRNTSSSTATTNDGPYYGCSYLAAIEFGNLSFVPLDVTIPFMTSSPQYQSLDNVTSRYTQLLNMEDVIMGTNGREKRRILAVASKNRIYQVMEMDEQDDENEDEV